MDKKREKHISKFASLILRHQADEMGVALDTEGWAVTQDLLKTMSESDVTLDELKDVVAQNEKQRFSFKEDFKYIRANQGHSLKNVQIQFETKTPPSILYHGTALKNLESIEKDGIKPMGRNLVHLSDSESLAKQVGARHGKAIVFKINTPLMMKDGISFFISANGVWLVDYVNSKYIEA